MDQSTDDILNIFVSVQVLEFVVVCCIHTCIDIVGGLEHEEIQLVAICLLST